MEIYGRILCLAFLMSMQILSIQSGGKVELRLLRYVNPDGEGANGHCCDGRAIFCFGACDHLFILCLDNKEGSNSMSTCPYGRTKTGRIEDANTITFGSRIGGTRNPMQYSFSKWPGSIKLKIHVEDHDSDNSNDFVDFLYTNLDITPATSSSTAIAKPVNINKRTRMSLTVKVYCDPMYFGPDCSVFCLPRDNFSGHYTCDEKTGNKNCIEGWTGEDCRTSIDECIGNTCQNGASCIDGHMSYTCKCPLGFQGTHCGQDIDECATNPCKNNGICLNFDGGFNCTCPVQWSGPDCTKAVDFCEGEPCNNSTCIPLDTTFSCLCNKGWTGTFCDENIDECLQNPCKNNATCIDTAGSYVCKCPDGFLGENCTVNKDECASNPCMNNATCVDLVNNFQCSPTDDITSITDLPDDTDPLNSGEHGAQPFQTQNVRKVHWAETHWYVILIIAAVAILLLIIPGAIYIKRNRAAKKIQTNDMVQYWPTQEQMSGHGFDNVIYGMETLSVQDQISEYQPQRQFTVTEIDQPS